jgi:feruloyl esterase
MALVRSGTGTVPKHSYFIGGSQGGHEALIAALFYPLTTTASSRIIPAYDIT